MARQLVELLAPSVAFRESNVETNRKVWDLYAKDWKPDCQWVRKMAENLGEEWNEADLNFIGDEWSDRFSLQQVLDEFILPYCLQGCKAMEIGCGGGRVAVSEFHCADISSEMLRKAKQKVKEMNSEAECKIAFDYLESAQLPDDCSETFDFIYSFDCFPHCDTHTIFKYLKEIRRALKSDGKAMIHTANITTGAGFQRFAKQKEASVS